MSEKGDGRDHNPYGFSMWLAGGGVKGGQIIGQTDEFGLHAVENRSVDVMLAFTLMIGGVIGAQSGARAGQAVRAEQLRFLLGLLVLAVALRVGADLLTQPGELFSVISSEAGR